MVTRRLGSRWAWRAPDQWLRPDPHDTARDADAAETPPPQLVPTEEGSRQAALAAPETLAILPPSPAGSHAARRPLCAHHAGPRRCLDRLSAGSREVGCAPAPRPQPHRSTG